LRLKQRTEKKRGDFRHFANCLTYFFTGYLA
jgi:hypothetical protein